MAAAMNDDYSGDPFIVSQSYSALIISMNLACVTNDEECGFVMYMCSLIYQVEGAPDMIYSLTAGADPALLCEQTPKRKDRP